MPPVRPKIVQKLIGRRYVGSYVRKAHNFWLNSTFGLRRRIMNAQPRLDFERNPPHLDEKQQHVFNELQAKGMAHTTFRELVGDEDLWARLLREAETWVASEAVRTRESEFFEAIKTGKQHWKDYIVRMFGKPCTLSPDNAWLRLGLSPRFLDVVNSYLGLHGHLIYIDVWDCLSNGGAHDPTGSQMWHRDPEDIPLCKIFLYLNDVRADAGAMHYALETRVGERFGYLWPARVASAYRPPAQALEKIIPESNRIVCSFPQGTILFADTSAIHQGGRAIEGKRLIATWSYTGPATLHPVDFRAGDSPSWEDLPQSAKIAVAGALGR